MFNHKMNTSKTLFEIVQREKNQKNNAGGSLEAPSLFLFHFSLTY